jgi:hypothetical protein
VLLVFFLASRVVIEIHFEFFGRNFGLFGVNFERVRPARSFCLTFHHCSGGFAAISYCNCCSILCNSVGAGFNSFLSVKKMSLRLIIFLSPTVAVLLACSASVIDSKKSISFSINVDRLRQVVKTAEHFLTERLHV